MSKLVADNLRAMTDAVETPMKYPVQGSAKAWTNFNGTGTVAIRESLNISSLTDNGAGDYSKNFTASFAAATYLSSGTCGSGANILTTNHAQVTNTFRFTAFVASSGAVADPVYGNILSMGALA